MTKDFSYGIIAIIKEGGVHRFLIVEHVSSDYWGFPKGHKEGDESDVEAATRELAEETGVRKIKILSEPIFVEKYIFELDKKIMDKTVTFFLGFAEEKDLSLQESEITDARWGTYDEAMGLFSFDNQKDILKQVNDWLVSSEF